MEEKKEKCRADVYFFGPKFGPKSYFTKYGICCSTIRSTIHESLLLIYSI